MDDKHQGWIEIQPFLDLASAGIRNQSSFFEMACRKMDKSEKPMEPKDLNRIFSILLCVVGAYLLFTSV